MTMFPAINPSFVDWTSDSVRTTAATLLQKLHDSQHSVSTPYTELHRAAELSSDLTLDYYFNNLKRSAAGVLRFDEISAYSPRDLLQRFIEENDLAVKYSDTNDSSVLYVRILETLEQGGGTQILGGRSKRIDPLVEYGKLKPMPACEKNYDEIVALTPAVLEAYGVKKENHLHFSLSEILDMMHIPYQTDFTIHNGKIHMDLILTSVPTKAKIVISAYDLDSFHEGTKKINSHLNLKEKTLKSMGYNVVTVPYFDWKKLATPRCRVAYIAGKLSRAQYWGEGSGLFGKSGTIVKQILRDAVEIVQH